MRRPDLASLRAALWAARELARLRRDLRRRGIGGAAVTRPPALPDASVRGVDAALRRLGASCLERSLVRQKWYFARGIGRDVILGVTAPRSGFAAHAWLDGETAEQGSYHELRRLAPR